MLNRLLIWLICRLVHAGYPLNGSVKVGMRNNVYHPKKRDALGWGDTVSMLAAVKAMVTNEQTQSTLDNSLPVEFESRMLLLAWLV
jgi:hypothetical protein